MADLYTDKPSDLLEIQGALGLAKLETSVPPLRMLTARLITDDAAGLADIENWLGRPVDMITAFAETNNAAGTWADSLAATIAQANALAPLNRPVYWAFPGCHGTAGNGWMETVRGDHDATIAQMFQIIADIRPDDERIFVRGPWEMQFWSAYPHCRAFITAYQFQVMFRHIVKIGRSIDSRFVFDWCPNVRVLGADGRVIDPTVFYPGDLWVDIIATDAYLRYEIEFGIHGLTPAQTIANVWDGEWGINQLYDFAVSRGKSFGISETGINGDGTANNGATGDLYSAHFNRMAEFVRSRNVVFHGLWNKATPFNCRLTNNQYPQASAAYKAAFEQMAKPWSPALHFGRELLEHRDASDVSTMTMDGALVTSWADKVAGKLASSTASARPTYSATARNGLPGVTADGADDVLLQTDVANVPAMGKAHTTFIQAFVASGAANFAYLLADTDATGGGTNTRAIGHNGGNLRVQAGNVGYAGGAVRPKDSSIVISMRDAYSSTTLATTLIGSIDGNTPWADNVSLPMPNIPITKRVLFANGAASDGVANRIAATLQEVGTIARAITRDERALLHGYLAHKWGRAADLPEAHPYKSSPPTYGGTM